MSDENDDNGENIPLCEVNEKLNVNKNGQNEESSRQRKSRKVPHKINVSTMGDRESLDKMVFSSTSTEMSVTFKKEEINLLSPKSTKWRTLEIGDTESCYKAGVKVKADGHWCAILLKRTTEYTSSDEEEDNAVTEQVPSLVYCRCIVNNKDWVLGKKSTYWTETRKIKTVRCPIDKVPDEWTVKFILQPCKSYGDVFANQKRLTRISLFPENEHDRPEARIQRINWILTNAEARKLREYRKGKCICSAPFVCPEEEIAMCLELYPNGKDEFLENSGKFDVCLRMLQFSKESDKFEMCMSYKTCVNDHESNVKHYGYGDGRKYLEEGNSMLLLSVDDSFKTLAQTKINIIFDLLHTEKKDANLTSTGLDAKVSPKCIIDIADVPTFQVSETFKKDELPDGSTEIWKSELQVSNHTTKKFKIGLEKSDYFCKILLKNCSPSDEHSSSSIYWNCRVDDDNFTGNTSGNLALVENGTDGENGTAVVRECQLTQLPSEWRADFNLWTFEPFSKLLHDENSINLFSEDVHDRPKCSLRRVNWTLNEGLNALKNYTKGECICSQPFGDIQGETAMCLEVYPAGLTSMSEKKSVIILRMLHLPQLANGIKMWIKYKMSVNDEEEGTNVVCYGKEDAATCILSTRDFSDIFKESEKSCEFEENTRGHSESKVKIVFDILQIGRRDAKQEEQLRRAVGYPEYGTEELKSILKYVYLGNADFTDAIFKCFEENNQRVLEILMNSIKIQLNDGVIIKLSKKMEKGEIKETTEIEETLNLIVQKLKNQMSFVKAMADTFDYFANNFFEKSHIRKFMKVKSFREAAADYFTKLYFSLLFEKHSQAASKMIDVAQMIKDNNAEKLQDAGTVMTQKKNGSGKQTNLLAVVFNMNRITFWDVERFFSYHPYHALSNFYEFSDPHGESYLRYIGFDFPSLCAKYGRFELIQKFFELTISHDTILHAAFIIDKLEFIKSRYILSESQIKELNETLIFLDNRITVIIEQVMMDDRRRNKKIIYKYLHLKYKILKRRSIMDILIEYKCKSFLTSHIFIKSMNESWKGSFYEQFDFVAEFFKKKKSTETPKFRQISRASENNEHSTVRSKIKSIPIFFGALISYIPFLLIAYVLILAGCCAKTAARCKACFSGKEVSQTSCMSKITTKVIEFHKVVYEDNLFPPFARFIMDIIVQLAFICMMSYFVIRHVHFYLALVETPIYIYTISHVLEELHQLFTRGRMNYAKDWWNIVDWFAISFMFIGILLKNVPGSSLFHTGKSLNCSYLTSELAIELSDCVLHESNNKWLYIARIFLVIGVIFFFVKFSQMTLAFESLGLTQAMIISMIIEDLLPFLVILMIYVFGFGIVFSALTFPNSFTLENIKDNSTNFDFFSFSKVFIFGFYGLAGQYPVLDLTENQANLDNDELQNHGKPHDWSRYAVAYFLLPVYIIIVNILLLNLLIALFSKTVQRIELKSRVYRNVAKYNLINDYATRSLLPPPLNIFNVIYKLLAKMYDTIQRNPDKDAEEREEKFSFHALYSQIQYQTLTNTKRKNFYMPAKSKEKTELKLQIDGMCKKIKKNKQRIEELTEKLSESESKVLKAVKDSQEKILAAFSSHSKEMTKQE